MADHYSASQLTSWMYCGKQYYLERIARVPQNPAWFLIAGSAFHSATETLDTSDQTEWNIDELWEENFSEKIQDALKKQPDMALWTAAAGQDSEYWFDKGPELLQLYLDWRTNDAFKLGSLLATEYAFDVQLSDKIRIKGAIDRVYDFGIVDQKTGSKGASIQQLGIYRAALLADGFQPEPPNLGYTYKAREGRLLKAQDLSLWTPAYAAGILEQLAAARESGIYIPNPGFSCSSCSVQIGCYSAGGEQSSTYDPLDPSYVQ